MPTFESKIHNLEKPQNIIPEADVEIETEKRSAEYTKALEKLNKLFELNATLQDCRKRVEQLGGGTNNEAIRKGFSLLSNEDIKRIIKKFNRIRSSKARVKIQKPFCPGSDGGKWLAERKGEEIHKDVDQFTDCLVQHLICGSTPYPMAEMALYPKKIQLELISDKELDQKIDELIKTAEEEAKTNPFGKNHETLWEWNEMLDKFQRLTPERDQKIMQALDQENFVVQKSIQDLQKMFDLMEQEYKIIYKIPKEDWILIEKLTKKVVGEVNLLQNRIKKAIAEGDDSKADALAEHLPKYIAYEVFMRLHSMHGDSSMYDFMDLWLRSKKCLNEQKTTRFGYDGSALDDNSDNDDPQANYPL